MEDNDNDYFSDDGFDFLPPGTLLQLEQDAIARTAARQPVHDRDSAARNLPRNDIARQSAYDGGTLKLPRYLHTELTDDYGAVEVGELDAEVLDGDDQSVVALEQPPPALPEYLPVEGAQDSVSRSALQEYEREQRMPPYVDRMEVEDEDIGDSTLPDDLHGSYGRMQELAARIEELTRQNEQVLQELAAAKATAETKAGEISIIRSNQVRLKESYDRQLAALRKAMAEASTKHKEEVDAARAEGKMLATENAFLKHDLAEEAFHKTSRKAKGKTGDKELPTTPKKTKVLPFRDGFDDDEIIIVSPSKSRENRSKRGTPVVPGKRKRNDNLDISVQSPSLQLSSKVGPSDDAPRDVPNPVLKDTEHSEDLRQQKESLNVRYIKRIFNHRTPPNDRTDIEVLGSMSLPSKPQQTLSAIVLGQMSSLHSGNCLVDHGKIIASLWSRALKEKFFEPIPIFMSITRLIFTLDSLSSIPELIEHLVPVLQESAEVNGVPRFQHSPVSRQSLGQIRQTPLSALRPEVDSTEALSLLYHVACACLHMEPVLQNFWRHIRYDFILMTLNCSQPVKDIILSLNLLATSIRPDSFGPILETEQDQRANEAYIIDRAAYLLSETLQVDEGQDPYTPFEISNMRLESLAFLTAVAFNPIEPVSTHGSSVIATHPTVLARLVRTMHDELNALYSYPPERDMHTSMVNGLMRLIYGVMRIHGDSVDLQSKLRRVAGGKQKFLVVLTRLAFSDGPILEAGITDETVEMAHEILDGAVNPQEAEALLEAFPTGRPPDETGSRDGSAA